MHTTATRTSNKNNYIDFLSIPRTNWITCLSKQAPLLIFEENGSFSPKVMFPCISFSEWWWLNELGYQRESKLKLQDSCFDSVSFKLMFFFFDQRWNTCTQLRDIYWDQGGTRNKVVPGHLESGKYTCEGLPRLIRKFDTSPFCTYKMSINSLDITHHMLRHINVDICWHVRNMVWLATTGHQVSRNALVNQLNFLHKNLTLNTRTSQCSNPESATTCNNICTTV